MRLDNLVNFATHSKNGVLKIYHEIDHFTARKAVVTIGTFDGVHLGHQKVIDQINDIAKAIGGESVIFTFYPHPRMIVSNDQLNLRLLTTLEEKSKLLEKANIDNLVVYPFTKEFAALTYDKFIKEILIDKLQMNTLVVGHDHRLGKNREGNYDNICKLADKIGFTVERIDAFLMGEIDISSSKIRDALQKGDVERANLFLGYEFSLTGIVIEGNRLGRSLGFPTANILASDPFKIIPAEGVYAVKVEVNSNSYFGMLNIGHRPTVNMNADNRTIEVHIFDFNENIYQKEITIKFYTRLRDEKKFDGLNALKTQLNLDEEITRRFFE